MEPATCPSCGCTKFYVKNPHDQYETYSFECRDGRIYFESDMDSAECPQIEDGTQTYCIACAWHDKFSTLK